MTEALPVGIMQIDVDRRVLYANSRLATMLGATRTSTLDEQLELVLDEDRGLLFKALAKALTDGEDGAVEIAFRAPNREIRRGAATITAVLADNGSVTGAIFCLTDITRDIHLRQQLEDRATYDSLTRCRNRASIMVSLDDLLATRSSTGVAVMFIDLDGFKEINDRLGHAAGDQLLARVGRRLLSAGRSRDMVGRVGGDEFLVVCDDVASPAIAMSIARRAAGRIRATVALAGERLAPRASIGVVWSTAATLNSEQLINEADSAMYESKQEGSGIPILRTFT
jgi:diguanylate cyclase (GGDEF)-like protein/PAS domain S-box-containing protein